MRTIVKPAADQSGDEHGSQGGKRNLPSLSTALPEKACARRLPRMVVRETFPLSVSRFSRCSSARISEAC